MGQGKPGDRERSDQHRTEWDKVLRTGQVKAGPPSGWLHQVSPLLQGRRLGDGRLHQVSPLLQGRRLGDGRLHQVSPLLQGRRLGDGRRRRAGQSAEAGQGRLGCDSTTGRSPLVRQCRVVSAGGRLVGAEVAGAGPARVQQVRRGSVQRRGPEVRRPGRLGGVCSELAAGRLH